MMFYAVASPAHFCLFTFFLRNLSYSRQKEAKPLAVLDEHGIVWIGKDPLKKKCMGRRSILLILVAFYKKRTRLCENVARLSGLDPLCLFHTITFQCITGEHLPRPKQSTMISPSLIATFTKANARCGGSGTASQIPPAMLGYGCLVCSLFLLVRMFSAEADTCLFAGLLFQLKTHTPQKGM